MHTPEYVTGGNITNYQPSQPPPDQITAKFVLNILVITGMFIIITGTIIVAITHAPAAGIIATVGMCIAFGSLLIRDSLH